MLKGALVCPAARSFDEQGELTARPEPPKYFQFESEKGGLDYKITSLGHPISLRTEYPKSSLRRYEIKLRKGRDTVMKSSSLLVP